MGLSFFKGRKPHLLLAESSRSHPLVYFSSVCFFLLVFSVVSLVEEKAAVLHSLSSEGSEAHGASTASAMVAATATNAATIEHSRVGVAACTLFCILLYVS